MFLLNDANHLVSVWYCCDMSWSSEVGRSPIFVCLSAWIVVVEGVCRVYARRSLNWVR